MDKITEDKIKQAANVVDVISDFITLRKRGVEYQGLCPFHDDQTVGNFSVNPAKGMYKCFACGAGGDAIKFLMEYRGSKLSYGDALKYLAKKYSIPIPNDDHKDDDRWQHIKPATPKPIIETHKEPIYMSRDVVRQTMEAKDNINFVSWFRSLPWDRNQMQRVEDVLWQYCVGGWSDGRVCFWQIDETGRPHSAKLMRYQDNGKRDRDKVRGKTGWLHNQPGIAETLDLEHHEHQSCLFGAHLLKRYPNASVNIVESEKTALIMAVSKGSLEANLWLACGGLQFFKIDSMKPLFQQKRTVYLWPDRDGMNAWLDKLKQMPKDADVRLYTRFLDHYWIEADGEKADVADIAIRLMEHPETAPRQSPELIGNIIARNPHINKLIDPSWNDGEPFYTLTPLQQRMRDAVEMNKLLRRQQKEIDENDWRTNTD